MRAKKKVKELEKNMPKYWGKGNECRSKKTGVHDQIGKQELWTNAQGRRKAREKI